ncbi:hypothetical protein OG883_38445 [Streptomyces sp. NBC_01142]|uniref:hypothetical protein n=1 Tax=Streptomyces sp. NBC_01142 TaxID=2975865 RepID=UPI00224E5BCB|nr:hypothetical protein [Streptomyces sp. NBC_01142]MCX4825632.1 hypothetical protein [Streptomyces sp. NBC_01142]
MSTLDHHDWSFTTAREPASFAACQETDSPSVEHALAGSATLCGIRQDQVTVYRHPFFAERAEACSECRKAAADAPTEPGVQERLHGRVEVAVPGSLRDELLEALRKGADVRLWVNGPADRMVRHYAELDRIVDGGEPIEAVLRGGGRLGLARVVHGAREFVVFLPEDGATFVARAKPGS